MYTGLKHLTNRARSSIEFPKFRKWNSVFITQTRTTLRTNSRARDQSSDSADAFGPGSRCFCMESWQFRFESCTVIRVDCNGPAEMKEFHRNDVVNLVNTKRGRRERFFVVAVSWSWIVLDGEIERKAAEGTEGCSKSRTLSRTEHANDTCARATVHVRLMRR